jgi:hypothetical protein
MNENKSDSVVPPSFSNLSGTCKYLHIRFYI